jgi:hypothetical protein
MAEGILFFVVSITTTRNHAVGQSIHKNETLVCQRSQYQVERCNLTKGMFIYDQFKKTRICQRGCTEPASDRWGTITTS